MNDIVNRENEPDSIKMLIAQRELYSWVKWLTVVQFGLSVVLPTSLAFAQIHYKSISFDLIIGGTSFLSVILSEWLLDMLIDSIKEKASKIQESFDCHVLNISWNRVLAPELPEHGQIFRNYVSSKYARDPSKLVNWYELDVAKVPEDVGRIICQKTNCNYDNSIKRKYQWLILGVSAIALFAIVFPSFFNNLTVQEVLLTLICPMMPVFQWTVKHILKISQSVSTLTHLNSKLNGLFEQSKLRQNLDCDFRQIQDGIFLNRMEKPLIPDFIYNMLRDNLEKETKYTVEKLVEEYLNP